MRLRDIPLFLKIAAAMVAGGLLGLWLGPRAAPLGEIGALVIALIKALAPPLLFLAILDSFLTADIQKKDAFRLLSINATNAAIALVIGLSISNIFQPGRSLTPPSSTATVVPPETLDFAAALKGYIPTNIFRPFLEDALISIILIAVFLGLALRATKLEQKATGDSSFQSIEAWIKTAYRTVQIAIGWIVRLVPLAVFSVVAKTVGEHGLAPLSGLAVYVGVALFGILLHVAVVYQGWILLVAKMPLRRFWSGCRDALVYALGASSSLATLPVTLRSLERMGVSKESSTLAACIGTNLNNDSILLYEAMAALFVAQAYGIDLSFGQQLVVAGACVIAGIGIAGVPDAGLISLTLVMGTVGLPVEILPLLLTVDWILSRARAASNVTCDFVVAILLDRFRDKPALSKSTESKLPSAPS